MVGLVPHKDAYQLAVVPNSKVELNRKFAALRTALSGPAAADALAGRFGLEPQHIATPRSLRAQLIPPKSSPPTAID